MPDLSRLTIDRDAAGASPRRAFRLALALGAAAALVVAGALAFAWRDSAVPVQVVVARAEGAGGGGGGAASGGGATAVVANGYVVARTQASVSSKVPGRLAYLGVHEGSRVRAGEVIARLENAEYAAGVGQAEAALQAERATLIEAQADRVELRGEASRAHDLRAKNPQLISPQDVDLADSKAAQADARVLAEQARVQAAEAALAVARANLENTVIRAPFSGTVLRKDAEVGEVVAPSVGGGLTRGAVVTMADMATLEVEVDVNEAYIARVHPGQPARITLDAYPDTSFAGHVRLIVPTADRNRATVQVKVAFTSHDPRVLPEMSARVDFLAPAGRAASAGGPPARFLLPAAAVQEDSGGTFVWVVRDGRLARRVVEAGPTSGGQREVGFGLLGGEQVYVGGAGTPRQGLRVTVGARLGMALVEMRDVHKAFHRDSQRIEVFANLTVEFDAGSFTALMGPSGSGKSTLLNLIAGLDRATAGSVIVAGADVATLRPAQLAAWRARHIGFVFQSANLLPVLTAAQNVELPLLLAPLSRKARRERVAFALEIVGLQDRTDHFPRQLSGGQEQRVAIARAVVADPTLILLDEPTGQLDAHSSEELLTLLRRLNDEFHKSIIMVTHDAHAAEQARTVLHLEKGVLVERLRAGV